MRASSTRPQQTALPGGTGQPNSQATLRGKSPSGRALSVTRHLRGAAATLQTLFPLQEQRGFACCPPHPATAPYSVPFRWPQQPQTLFSRMFGRTRSK